MVVRTGGVLAIVLVTLASPAGPALAQFLPSLDQLLPFPLRPQPPAQVEPYEPAPGYGRPAAPGPYGSPQYGRQGAPDDYGSYATPRGNVYREELPPPVGYENDPRQRYGGPPAGYEAGYETDPRARASAPRYGAQPQTPQYPQDATRPPLSIGPGAQDDVVGALPPEDRPETGPTKELPPQFRRTTVDYRTREPAGTIIIDTPNTYLYLVLGNGKAMRYGIGVGREGFTWTGAEKISRMAEWPDWHPPAEMIERQPYLPRFMAGGPGNPLGARALYLGKTLYRIHGTNQPSTIGTFVSSGCIRLTNEDVADLYYRVQVGTRVVVLPGGGPTTAPAPSADAQQTPYNPLATPPIRR